jgi:AraC-like DNA-binding protein/Tfp pilus assembly protein PilF
MRLLSIFLLALFTPCGFSQSGQIDSLQKLLKNSFQDTTQVILLNELSLRILKSDPEQAKDYGQQALALATQLKFENGVGEAKNNLAAYQLMTGNADDALALALDAIRIGEKENRVALLANGHAILGTVYHNLLTYEKALFHLHLAQQLNINLKSTLVAGKIFNALGGIARDQGKNDSALYFYQKAMMVMKEGNDNYRVPEVLNNIGIIYTRQNQIKLGREYYNKALQAAEENDNRRAKILALTNIGGILLSEKKYKEAERTLMEALTHSKAINNRKSLSTIYMTLGQLKNETQQFDEAHFYISKFYELKDSLINLERIKKIAELEIRYETEKKINAIQLLEKDKKVLELWTNILIVAVVLLIIGMVEIYYFLEFRERKNRKILNLEIDHLLAQRKDLSEKYKSVVLMAPTISAESADQRILKKAIEVIEKHMSNSAFGVEEMALKLAMSRTNMHRKIKAITGFPPSELIKNMRLRKAAALLLRKADSVAQIGYMVGFDDSSYFSKLFKKNFGVTPSEYAKLNADEGLINSP